ncbi:MAG: hypothetical protein K2Y37_17550 [Pirellulales bacterium]|nr:hypothetical protein [Pirellulales bacterium]
MSVRYQLPCTCGRMVLVERSQAGLAVICTCGAKLEVPTIGGLAHLESVETATSGAAWTTQHGLILIGVLVALVAGGAAVYRFIKLPRDLYGKASLDDFMQQKAAEIDRWTPGEVVEAWQQFRGGPYIEDPEEEKHYYAARAEYTRWTWVLAVLAAAGVLFAVIVLVLGAGGPRGAPRSRRVASRS